jgi:uncharacterized LabA/DUF88 family protein
MDVIHYRPEIDTFCLVTNDADYVPLCDKIHETKKSVIGVGYQHAAEAFIRSCDQFIFIGKKQTSKPSSTKIPIRNLVSKAFVKATQDANGWVTLSALGSALRQIQAEFNSKKYGYAKLSKLLQDMPDFVESQSNNNIKSVRLKK